MNSDTLRSGDVLVSRMINGGEVSQIVGAVAAFGVPDLLVDGPRHAEELGRELSVEPNNLYRLLRAAVTVGVLDEVEPRTFRLNEISHRLRSNVPGSMRQGALANTDPFLWLPWLRLREAIQSGTEQVTSTFGSNWVTYLNAHPQEAEHFFSWMGQRSELLIDELVEGYDFSPFHLVVDVGGAHGHLLAAIAQQHPALKGIVFDQPEVVANAPAVLKAKGVYDRCDVAGGDFFQSVPAGGDLYVLKNVIHDWPDEAAKRILATVRAALGPAGTLLVVDHVLPPDGERADSHLMDLTMMVMTGARERTLDEFTRLFADADLRVVGSVPVADHTVLVAQPT